MIMPIFLATSPPPHTISVAIISRRKPPLRWMATVAKISFFSALQAAAAIYIAKDTAVSDSATRLSYEY